MNAVFKAALKGGITNLVAHGYENLTDVSASTVICV
jgi:hypothetical protein